MNKIKQYKKIIIIALIIFIILIAWKIYGIYKEANPNVDFKIVKLEKRDLVKTISIDGEVVADYEINLASEIPGIISRVYVEEGDFVKKGQLLMKLKDTDYRTKLNTAYLSKKISENTLEKVKNPNHNIEKDKEILENNLKNIEESILKIEDDINIYIEKLESYLDQFLRFNIDDYFAHTETTPVFNRRIGSETKMEILEDKRLSLGNNFKIYQGLDSKDIAESKSILNQFVDLSNYLYSLSIDFLGYSDAELEVEEKKLLSLRDQILAKKNELNNLENSLEQLENQLENIKNEREKLDNIVSETDVKIAQERVNISSVETNNAYLQLQKTYIRAPKSGIVVSVLGDQGEYAAPSQPLIKVSSQNKYIKADIPEVDIAKIKSGMDVQIKMDAFKDKVFIGKVDFVYPQKKEIFGIIYYEVKILFNSDDLKKENILPGMSVEIIIPYEKKDNVWSLDREVIQKEENKYFINILNEDKKLPKDDKFLKKYFEVGFIGDNFIEIINSNELKSFKILEIKNEKAKK